MKSYDVTIQMKPLWQYFHMILQDEVWKFCLNLILATFGSERVNIVRCF